MNWLNEPTLPQEDLRAAGVMPVQRSLVFPDKKIVKRLGYKPENMADSKDEVYFSWWLDELQMAGAISTWEYQTPTIELSKKKTYEVDTLSPKLKKPGTKKYQLFPAHTYTADFFIVWGSLVSPFHQTLNMRKRLDRHFVSQAKLIAGVPRCVSRVDIKPSYVKRTDNETLFRVNQKWVFDKTGIYIQAIQFEKLFSMTFTPQRYMITDKGQAIRKIRDWKVRSLEDFLGSDKL